MVIVFPHHIGRDGSDKDAGSIVPIPVLTKVLFGNGSLSFSGKIPIGEDFTPFCVPVEKWLKFSRNRAVRGAAVNPSAATDISGTRIPGSSSPPGDPCPLRSASESAVSVLRRPLSRSGSDHPC